MNTVFISIQYFGILLLLFEIAYILYQPPSFNQSMMLIFTTSALINTIGYLLELKATNKELAMYAVKFIYIGKPYIVISMFLFILKYCCISYPKPLGITLFSLHTFISMSVLTCEYHNWFYTSIDFTSTGIFPHLILGHGILYYLYMILIVIYSLCMMAICILRFFRSKDHSERVHLVTLTIVTLIPLLCFLIYLFGVTNGYDITAPSYIVCATLLLICYLKYNFLGAIRVAKDDVLDNIRDGILFINNYSELLYVNKIARELYPKLTTNHPHITMRQIQAMASQGGNLYIDQEVYAVHENEVYDQKKKVGNLIKIENITDSYNYTKRLQHDVRNKIKEIHQIQHSFITSFANLVEARDGSTGTHIKNTSRYVSLLCQELKKHDSYKEILTDEYIESIIDAAPLHDIGKISIPDAILQKPRKLTKEEFDIIKTHSDLGDRIIRDIMEETGYNFKLEITRKMAKYHHERWDGTGYPCGLKGEEIPLCARIMALADVYDAILSKRCYKEAMAKEKALEIIRNGAGTIFDPMLTKIFLSIGL